MVRMAIEPSTVNIGLTFILCLKILATRKGADSESPILRSATAEFRKLQ